MSKLNVNSLFQTAHAEGDLSAASLQVLTLADVGQAIQGALGVSVESVQSSEVMLLTKLIDDSGSIRFVAGNAQAVRDGHNLVIDALTASKQSSAILAHCRYLNGMSLYDYRPVDQAVRMTAQNYDPRGGTPLYDQTVVMLGAVLAKRQEFTDNGMVARSVSLIITDGADEHSVTNNAEDVRKIVTDLLRQETHIVAAMGIDDGSTNFREVFREMGVSDEWILTPGNTQSEIRRAFQVFSQSAVRASQAAGASFSKVAMGGFAVN